jgi:hypothetical protein
MMGGPNRREFLGMLGGFAVVAAVPAAVVKAVAPDGLDELVEEMLAYPLASAEAAVAPLPDFVGWLPMPEGELGELVRAGSKFICEMPGVDGHVFETRIVEARWPEALPAHVRAELEREGAGPAITGDPPPWRSTVAALGVTDGERSVWVRQRTRDITADVFAKQARG